MHFYRLILFFFLFPSLSYAQLFRNEACGTENIILEKCSLSSGGLTAEKISEILSSYKYDKKTQNVYYRVPLKFWIYKKRNKDTGLSLKKVKEHLQMINAFQELNNTGFRFYLYPEIDYVTNAKLWVMDFVFEAPAQTIKRKMQGVINVHATHKILKGRWSRVASNYAGTYHAFSRSVLIAQGISSSSLTHEIGHYFGLKHPHRNWDHPLWQEPVSRTRTLVLSKRKVCSRRGDGLCDTPAEPMLSLCTTDSCRFIGTYLTDKYGETYHPHTDNIMSYTKNRECRKHFTRGQIALMLHTAEKDKNAKIWSTSNRKGINADFDIYEPDDFVEMASRIVPGEKQEHSFHQIATYQNKKRKQDELDFLELSLESLSPFASFTIRFSKHTKYDFPKMQISIYKEDMTLFKEFVIDKRMKKIHFSPKKSGTYFFKIKRLSNMNRVGGYQIVINQNR